VKILGIDNSNGRVTQAQKVSNATNNTHRDPSPKLMHARGNCSINTDQKPFSDFLKECGVPDDSYE
jgi:hypothetical protein